MSARCLGVARRLGVWRSCRLVWAARLVPVAERAGHAKRDVGCGTFAALRPATLVVLSLVWAAPLGGCEGPQQESARAPDVVAIPTTADAALGGLGEATADATSPVESAAQREKLFSEAYHLDVVLGRSSEAEPIYHRIAREGAATQRETALAHLRLAALSQARGDQRTAMPHLDWLINHARQHPALARAAEHEMVDLLHPQAGRVSALTRGPPVSFTRLLDVSPEVASQFRDAEQALLQYLRVALAPQLHNVDAVVAAKRGALLVAIRAYDALVRSPFFSAQAAGLFRQGSLYQDFAEALGRLRLPEELLPRVAAQLRSRFHAESVNHFRAALEHYRRAAAVTDVSAEPWRQAALQAEQQLGRFARRLPPQGVR